MNWIVQTTMEGRTWYLTASDTWSQDVLRARVFTKWLLADLNAMRHGRGVVVEEDTAVWQAVTR